MSAALFVSTFRQSLRTLATYAVAMVLYLWVFIWIYPSFAGSTALNAMLKTLPPGLLKVLGYSVRVTHLSGFLTGEFYSLLYLIILAIYAILTGTRLMAHLVDNGFMGYLLATPVSRRRIASTQALVLLGGVFLIAAATTGGGLLGAHWFAPHAHIAPGPFVEMNLVGMLVFAVVAAYSFVFSALAPDERTAIGLSTTVTLLFYSLHVVGDLSTRLRWAANLSLFTLFNPPALMGGHGPILTDSLWLVAATITLLGLAVAGFQRRQLSL